MPLPKMLRREGYAGGVTIISDDAAAPYDRPNLSKDYLAGTAPEEWIPLRPPEFYLENGIELRLGTTATAIDIAGHRVMLGGEELGFDKLLLATGAEPIRLQVPGADLPHVRTLRSLADSRDLIARAPKGSHAVVVGASFIGLEAAAALRHRQVEVHVVAPEARPMERVLGPELGDFVRQLHESHVVVFHLGHTVGAIEAGRGSARQRRSDRRRPRRGRNRRAAAHPPRPAGRIGDRSRCVGQQYLETSAPGIFAAGDIARWPDAYSGEQLRIEHWVVAERQGQTAARNMLGRRERYAAVPFFWSQHYDVSIDYVGHANAWDEIVGDGDPNAHDAALRFRQAGRTLAVATIFRGRESLLAEAAMERGQSP